MTSLKGFVGFCAVLALWASSAAATPVNTTPQGYAGCAGADFVTLGGAEQVVKTTPENTFAPKCLRVKVGTKVTILASGKHPVQGVGNLNPLRDARGPALSPKTIVFKKAGLFGYFCERHGTASGSGMAGAILAE